MRQIEFCSLRINNHEIEAVLFYKWLNSYIEVKYYYKSPAIITVKFTFLPCSRSTNTHDLLERTPIVLAKLWLRGLAILPELSMVDAPVVAEAVHRPIALVTNVADQFAVWSPTPACKQSFTSEPSTISRALRNFLQPPTISQSQHFLSFVIFYSLLVSCRLAEKNAHELNSKFLFDVYQILQVWY